MNPTKYERGGGRRGLRVPATLAVVGLLFAGVVGTSLISVLGSLSPEATSANAQRSPGPEETTGPKTTRASPKLHLDRSEPVRLRIPAIGVNTRLLVLGKQKNKDLVELPPPSRAGWYKKSVTPGQLGVSTIIGYIRRSESRPGVFANLAELGKGDTITVRRKDGKTAVFRVDEITSYRHEDFPAQQVYQPTGRAELRIITSGGTLHPDDPPKSNVVVHAHLVDIRGG